MKSTHFKTFLLALIAAILPQLASAHDFMVNGIYYNINGTNAIVTYRGDSYSDYSNEYAGSVNIPSIVTYNGTTYSVTTIGGLSFFGCSGLTSVTIPNSVTTIGDYAFKGCTCLTSVTIPNSVTSIGNSAFMNCSGLTSVTIPNSVTSISRYAFHGCSGLTTITIPNSVMTIGGSAFKGCSCLTSVDIPNSVTSIGTEAFSGCCCLTSVDIPNSVTTIGDYAFKGCTCLTSLNIGNSLTEFSTASFEGCIGLTKIVVVSGNTNYDSRNNCNAIIETATNTLFMGCKGSIIPNSVTSIDDSAFYGCSGLTSVTIPNSVTSISRYAFHGCSGLTTITIPNSMTEIDCTAFSGCTGLTSVIWNAKSCETTDSWGLEDFFCGPFYYIRENIKNFTFGEDVEKIPDCLCYGMSKLTSLTIPNSVTSIGGSAFSGCTGLTSVLWNAKSCADFSADSSPFNEIQSNIQNLTFGESVEKIPAYLCYKMRGLTSVTIPNSVTSIGSYAFNLCSGLTSVTIPNSVTSIGSSAFEDCIGLTSVTIPNSVEAIGYKAFDSTPWDNALPNGMNYAGLVAYKYKGDMPANTSITINEGTKGVAGGAFYGKNGLSKLFVPNSVTNIGDYAFYNRSSIDSITCEAIVPPTIYGNTFSFNYNGYPPSYNSCLTVPYESSSSYHAAPYWNYFNNISFDWSTNILVSSDTIRICRGIDSDFSVPVVMRNSRPITAMQCDMDVSSSISIKDVALNNSRNGGDHTISYYNKKILIVSPTLKTFKGSDGPLFNINFHTNSTTTGRMGHVTLSNIILSTTDGAGIFRLGYTIPVYMTYLIGDANGDGSVDAADYVVTCNKIALRPVTTFFQDAANVNQDSHLDVSDLVGITRIALGLDATQMRAPSSKDNHHSDSPADVMLYSQNIEIVNGETATLTIKLNSPIAYKAMQMDVTLPAGLTITAVQLGDRASALQLMAGETEEGSTRLVASTMGDGAISTGDGVLLTLTLAADSQWSGDGTITINNIIAATQNAKRHEIEGITINATGTPSGIGAIITEDDTLVDVYNLNGQMIRHNVKRSEAVKSLPSGYYLIDNEKVYVK